jgi:tetratricopeptide (TPR) repeat protein
MPLSPVTTANCANLQPSFTSLAASSYIEMARSLLLKIDEDATHYAENFFELGQRHDWFLSISSTGLKTCYGGLVAFRIYRKSGESKWLERAKQCKALVELWATEGSEWNFGQKLALLQAEFLYSCGSFAEAEAFYDEAISLARSHSFLVDEALSYELSGYFYLNTGMTAKALERFTSAVDSYSSWGAETKANVLSGFIRKQFTEVLVLSMDHCTLRERAVAEGNIYHKNRHLF